MTTPAERARRERIKQGLPPQIEDAAAYAMLAELLVAAHQREQKGQR